MFLYSTGVVARHFTSLPDIAGLSPCNILDLFQAGMCTVCVHRAHIMHKDGREEFWAVLPSFFGLPSWEELRHEQKEVYVFLLLFYGRSLTVHGDLTASERPCIRLRDPASIVF